MRSLSAPELLGVWEQALPCKPFQRALLLLSAAWPEMTLQQVAQLSIGRRDALLLTLREWMFGSQLVSLAVCPACAERLEFTFQVSDVQVTAAPDATDELTLTVAGYQVRYRLPTTLDLNALVESPGKGEARQQLLEYCLYVIEYEGEAQPIEQLPLQVIEAVEAEMARLDPQADIHIQLTCPGCQYTWAAPFDIGSFFWQEINAWAYRTLREVHLLASVYGWSEADILAMSPWKRQLYLQMVHG